MPTASYDFLRQIGYFEPTATVSRAQMQNLINAEASQGYVAAALTVDRLTLPGLTALSP